MWSRKGGEGQNHRSGARQLGQQDEARPSTDNPTKGQKPGKGKPVREWNEYRAQRGPEGYRRKAKVSEIDCGVRFVAHKQA